jgi:asparaginyl-tRNA synthetase
LAEFWMLEAEVAFVTSVQEVMNLCEENVKSVLRSLVANDAAPLGLFAARESVRSRISQALGTDSDQGWMRLSYTEAIGILQRHQASLEVKPFDSDPVWGLSLSSDQEKYLAGDHAKGPVFVYDYPADLKPFYMLPTPGAETGERKTAACFDLLVPGVGELAGGSLREHRLKELVETIE